jgi:hypothetical protein
VRASRGLAREHLEIARERDEVWAACPDVVRTTRSAKRDAPLSNETPKVRHRLPQVLGILAVLRRKDVLPTHTVERHEHDVLRRARRGGRDDDGTRRLWRRGRDDDGRGLRRAGWNGGESRLRRSGVASRDPSRQEQEQRGRAPAKSSNFHIVQSARSTDQSQKRSPKQELNL